MIVVLRNLPAAGGVDLRGRVVKQRCRRDARLGKRLRVKKRFELEVRLAKSLKDSESTLK